jgi:hypothetical protein
MPSAPRLSEADSKTSTGVPCLYAYAYMQLREYVLLLGQHASKLTA